MAGSLTLPCRLSGFQPGGEGRLISNLTQIELAISQILARIVEITASANPTISVAGRTIGKTEYLRELRDALRDLREQKALEDGGGAWEVRGRGVS